MENFIGKNREQRCWLNLAVSIIVAVNFIAHFLFRYFEMSTSHNNYGFTEIMINFEGGFVRRGLLGQLLYCFCSSTGWDPFLIIEIFCTIIYLRVLYLFFRGFHKRHLCWWLLLSPLVFGITTQLVRKDYLCFLLIVGIFSLLREKNTSGLKILCATLLMVFGLFMHEAFIFFGVPLGILLMLTDRQHLFAGILSTICVAACFFLLCHFKGNQAIVTSIYDSWNNLGQGELLNPNIQTNSIGALGWDTLETIKMHFTLNFYHEGLGWTGLIYRPMSACVFFYFFVNALFVFKTPDTNFSLRDRDNLGATYLFALICLLPMFTILSCDYARIYQYAAVVALGALIMIPPARLERVFPRKYLSLVHQAIEWMNRNIIPSKGLMLVLLFILAPIPAGYVFEGSIKKSILYFLLEGIERTLHFIYNIFI